jgi:hypothetical protein
MSIGSSLSALQTAKADIADAIEAKGGTVGAGDGFSDFATDIATIPEGGGDGYTRPADWLTVPTPDEDKIHLLVPVRGSGENKYAFSLVSEVYFYNESLDLSWTEYTGQFTVDWGDGTTENYFAATYQNQFPTHTYDFATISNSTLTSEGYKQAVIQITITDGFVDPDPPPEYYNGFSASVNLSDRPLLLYDDVDEYYYTEPDGTNEVLETKHCKELNCETVYPNTTEILDLVGDFVDRLEYTAFPNLKMLKADNLVFSGIADNTVSISLSGLPRIRYLDITVDMDYEISAEIYNCMNLKKISFLSNALGWQNSNGIRLCDSLEEITLVASSPNESFYNAGASFDFHNMNIKKLILPDADEHEYKLTGINLSGCVCFSADAAVTVFNDVFDFTTLIEYDPENEPYGTINLTDSLAAFQLTDEYEIATDKGWEVMY